MDQGLTQHRHLQESGKWAAMSFAEQMANIGSEVSRACRWKEKGKPEMMGHAFDRCLELLDFTIALSNGPRLRELVRAREVLCDYFVGDNVYGSTGEGWMRYFDAFAFAARKDR